MTPKPLPFDNPWHDRASLEDVYRVHVELPRQVPLIIRSVCPDHGALRTATSKFIKFLYDTAIDKQWTLANRDEFISLVNERCTPCGVDATTTDGDDGRRAQGVRCEATPASDGQRDSVGKQTSAPRSRTKKGHCKK
jgi:hypothetical protein